MALYKDLRGLFDHNEMKLRVEVACIVAAEAIRTEDAGTDNHANRLLWAQKAFNNPSAVRDDMLMALIAANKTADVAAIIAADDATMQTKVDAAVDVFADGS